MSNGHRAHHVGDIMVTTPGITLRQRRKQKQAEEAEWASKSSPVTVSKVEDAEQSE